MIRNDIFLKNDCILQLLCLFSFAFFLPRLLYVVRKQISVILRHKTMIDDMAAFVLKAIIIGILSAFKINEIVKILCLNFLKMYLLAGS